MTHILSFNIFSDEEIIPNQIDSKTANFNYLHKAIYNGRLEGGIQNDLIQFSGCRNKNSAVSDGFVVNVVTYSLRFLKYLLKRFYRSSILNMDLSAEYLKNLIFSNKENAIIKIMDILPVLRRNNVQTKVVIMKMLPVLFSFAELNKSQEKIEKCLALIEKIKHHRYFIEEKSLLNGWEIRLRKFCGHEWTNETENKFSNNRFLFIRGTDMNDVIGYSELDLFLSFNKWLKYHKLHKYLYLFANLSYGEIEMICDEQTIRFYEQKVDLYPMTEGARKAVLRKLAELDQRTTRLKVFGEMEYFTSISKVERAIYEMKTILKTPIRRNSVFCRNNNIPDLLVYAIQTVLHQILKLSKNDFAKIYDGAISMLKLAWGCYFFEFGIKEKLNMWQSVLHSKRRSYSRRKPHQHIENCDVYAIQFDVEIGIKGITRYLENILQDDVV